MDRQSKKRGTTVEKMDIVNTSEEVEGNINHNSIVNDIFNYTSVKDEISIDSDEDTSNVLGNVSHIQWH